MIFSLNTKEWDINKEGVTMFEEELNLTQYLLIQNWYWDLLLNKLYTNTQEIVLPKESE